MCSNLISWELICLLINSPLVGALIGGFIIYFGWYKTTELNLKTRYLESAFLAFGKLVTEKNSDGTYDKEIVREINEAVRSVHLYGSYELILKVNKMVNNLGESHNVEDILVPLRNEFRKLIKIGKVHDDLPLQWVKYCDE